MGLISKATWLGVGYVLGARAGTARYEQIADAARKLANRPELQPHLGWLMRPAPAPSLDEASPAPATPPAPPAPATPPIVDPPTADPPAPVVTVTRRSRPGRRRN